MIETDWVACAADCARSEDTGAMEDYLEDKGSPRQLRLFACACCRRIESLLTDPRSLRAVGVAERYADGAGTYEELQAVWKEADQAASDIDESLGEEDDDYRSYYAALAAHWAVVIWLEQPDVVSVASHAAFYALRAVSEPYEALEQGRILSDILGRPDSLPWVGAASLTPTILALAGGISDDRAYDRLPILGDALEDAGCTDTALLDHLRGPGPHVRGCWALDAILGKS